MDEKERIIFAFLKRVVQRLEKELKIKGWEYSADNKNADVYVIGNESLNPSLIAEVDVEPKKILVFIYNYNSRLLKIIKEELPKTAKKLKIDDWTIIW